MQHGKPEVIGDVGSGGGLRRPWRGLRGTRRFTKWATVLVAATSLLTLVAVSPASAAPVASQATAQDLNVNVLGITAATPATTATNDGTDATAPITSTPTLNVPGVVTL